MNIYTLDQLEENEEEKGNGTTGAHNKKNEGERN